MFGWHNLISKLKLIPVIHISSARIHPNLFRVIAGIGFGVWQSPQHFSNVWFDRWIYVSSNVLSILKSSVNEFCHPTLLFIADSYRWKVDMLWIMYHYCSANCLLVCIAYNQAFTCLTILTFSRSQEMIHVIFEDRLHVAPLLLSLSKEMVTLIVRYIKSPKKTPFFSKDLNPSSDSSIIDLVTNLLVSFKIACIQSLDRSKAWTRMTCRSSAW